MPAVPQAHSLVVSITGCAHTPEIISDILHSAIGKSGLLSSEVIMCENYPEISQKIFAIAPEVKISGISD